MNVLVIFHFSRSLPLKPLNSLSVKTLTMEIACEHYIYICFALQNVGSAVSVISQTENSVQFGNAAQTSPQKKTDDTSTVTWTMKRPSQTHERLNDASPLHLNGLVLWIYSSGWKLRTSLTWHCDGNWIYIRRQRNRRNETESDL